MLWHSVDRQAGGSEELTTSRRQFFVSQLESSGFEVLSKDYFGYYEGYPMRVDILVLKRRG
jgi:hypothetical protein